MRRLPKCRVQPVGSANDQRHVVTRELPFLQFAGQRDGGQGGATFVQCNDARPPGNSCFNTGTFGGIERIQCLRAARFRLDRLEFHSEFTGKPLGVVCPGRLRPIRHPQTHGHNHQAHGSVRPYGILAS